MAVWGLAFVGVWSVASTGAAQVTWRGDFETGDTSQYSYILNGEVMGRRYVNVVTDTVARGMYAGRIELHDDARWPNGLRRVELSHQPEPSRTAAGSELYFAWSFYVETTLSRDPDQTIGYWESASSYRQLMAFQLTGDDLRFSTNLPTWRAHWTGDGVVTPGEWHRIAMRVSWSTSTGSVDVWFDGVQVVDGASAQTLADGNPAFIQFGLLRGDLDFADVPVIHVDEALEGSSLADVRFDDVGGPVMIDAGAVELDAGSGELDAGTTSVDAAIAPGEDGGPASDAGSAPMRDAGRSDPGAVVGTCACRVGARGGETRSALVSMIALLVTVAARRRAARRASQ